MADEDEVNQIFNLGRQPNEVIISTFNKYLSEHAWYQLKSRCIRLSSHEKRRMKFCKNALAVMNPYYRLARDTKERQEQQRAVRL